MAMGGPMRRLVVRALGQAIIEITSECRIGRGSLSVMQALCLACSMRAPRLHCSVVGLGNRASGERAREAGRQALRGCVTGPPFLACPQRMLPAICAAVHRLGAEGCGRSLVACATGCARVVPSTLVCHTWAAPPTLDRHSGALAMPQHPGLARKWACVEHASHV
jgi:hypothetical protein